MIPPPPPQPLDDIVYTPGTELCAQRPDAWTAQDVHTQERAAATCLLCPLLDACRAAIDDMEPVWGTQDTIWAGETPGQRKRRREAGGEARLQVLPCTGLGGCMSCLVGSRATGSATGSRTREERAGYERQLSGVPDGQDREGCR